VNEEQCGESDKQPRVHVDLDADVVGELHALRLRMRKRNLSATIRELLERQPRTR
jgi:hypothetical protein